MEALVIGAMPNLSAALPYLLTRAGFAVDVVTMSMVMRLSRYVRNVYTRTTPQEVAAFAEALTASRAKPYDWVIVTNDAILGEVVAWERRTGRQSCLLPLQKGANRRHLFSKIGLSRTLAEAGIRTPAFRAVTSRAEACEAAREIGYPVLVKRDASGGGTGVFCCHDEAALAALPDVWDEPVLIQRKIEGTLLDLSAIYLDGMLVHFSYSVLQRTVSRFGPSSLRRYYPLGQVDSAVFAELAALGHALGAHGFSNITAIDADDGSGRYYFEADLRPNVWVDYAVYLGDDPATRIRKWFSVTTVLTKENAAAAEGPIQTIPHYLRFSIFDLLFNHNRVWSYICLADAPLVWALILLRPFHNIVTACGRCVPRPWKRALRRRLGTKTRPDLTATG